MGSQIFFLSTHFLKRECQVITHKISKKSDQHFAQPESLQECYNL